MTEAEAKTKWCFHFIASHSDPRQPQSAYAVEQGEPGPFAHPCIGSACMAWRWASDFNELHERHPDAPDLKAIGQGYCGLAGAPQ